MFKSPAPSPQPPSLRPSHGTQSRTQSPKKLSARQVLANLKREVARPRRAESTKKDADTGANGGHTVGGESAASVAWRNKAR